MLKTLFFMGSESFKLSNKYFTREEFNLPDNAFVMAAFHKNRKITIQKN